MCNCGKKRTQLQREDKLITSNSHSRMNVPSNTLHQNAVNSIFEYTGKTALTVTGSITGRSYRFNRHGDMQFIDFRDVSGMLAVPVLRKI